MINIDFLTLKAFFLENIDFFIGARLQKIQQPTRKDFIFFLRNNSVSKKLYININPSIYHIAFMSADTEQLRNVVIPQKPPMFCMQLRKYIEGCRISDARVIENERILELHFETCDEFAQKKSLCLAVELMGKHSNVILYDRESSIITGCAHNVGAEKSRYRELKGGLKYIYPPKSFEVTLSDELKKQFEGLNSEQINRYLTAETYTPAILNDRYTLFSELLERAELQPSVSEMLDNYYSGYQAQLNLNSRKNKLREIIILKLKKNKNSISKINDILSKRSNSDKYKLYGELLTANLYKKYDYRKQIELYNYSDEKNVLIELDETKTMSENAQQFFKLYTKFKTTTEKSTVLLNNLKMEKEYSENVLYSIECAKSIAELTEIENELGISDKKNNQKQKIEINKIMIDNFEVYIGKNNKQNDFIVSKLAKDEDIWFHTKLCAGSHVLLKVNDIEPNEHVIFECAKLARNNSSAKQPSKVGVIYTKRKYIKKPPASPLGYVTYKNEKEILV